MGIVYEARQMSLNRKVALKVLKAGLGLTTQAVNRFRREAAAAAKLHHTNVVPIYATGEDGDYHFYAMELIEGSSLDRVIRAARLEREVHGTEGKLPGSRKGPTKCPTKSSAEAVTTVADGRATDTPETRSAVGETTTTLHTGAGYFDALARMFAEVADGLEHAHRQGVIHRDIKPSNLLLSPQGRLHLTDFGLARVLEEPGMTVTGEFMGSPLYMSPEQIAAGRAPLDHRTDIYSLGATLYEALTLQPPFTGERRDQIIAQILHKEPKPPRAIDRKIPPDLETISLKAMDKDPDRRYRTAGEFGEDLRRYVNRFAIAARRASLAQRTIKWARRHPGLATAVSMAVVCVLISVAAIVQVRSASSKLQAAERQKAVDQALLLAMSGDFLGAEKAIGQAERLGASAGYTRLVRGQLALHRGLNSEAVVHLKEATNQLPRSVAAFGLLMQATGSGTAWGLEGQSLATLTPESSLDYLVLGSAQCQLDPVQAVANLDRGVALGAGALSRLLRAQAMTWVALSSGALTDIRKAIADAEFADSLLAGTNAVARAAILSARLVEATLLEGKDEQRRQEVLAQAQAAAAALERFPDARAAAEARRDYFDYVGDEERFERALEQMMHFDLRFVDACAGMFFGQGDARRALALLDQDVMRRAQFGALLRECVQADLTGDVRSALKAPRRKAPAGFPALYQAAALLPLGFPAEAQHEVKQLREDFKFYFRFRNGWYQHLFSYYAGEIRTEQLIAHTGPSLLNQCEGHFAIALMHLSQGRRAEAKQHFKRCLRTRVFDWVEYRNSRALLKRMELDPNWPPWISQASQ